jgi:NAD(P)-dependent dehydrogenase (short-subunit alcohol dehydrogenase family)
MDLHLAGKTAVVTGGGGAICGAIARGLAAEGVAVAVWDISREAAEACAQDIRGSSAGDALAVRCDATEEGSVSEALRETLARFPTVDILVCGAGGSRREATTSPDLEFFDLAAEDMKKVVDLNYLSAVLPAQAVGRIFAENKAGVIVTISSIVGERPITRSVSYSSGKAALNNFTRWLAVHMATTYSPAIRVNAVEPGFILTEQNRFLLVDEKTGAPSDRTRQIISRVPQARLGEPQEIVGAVLWLVSDWARFVTGAVIPVDGGFTASAGV